MTKFNNPLVEDVCASLLSPRENEVKLVGLEEEWRAGSPQMIGHTQESIDFLNKMRAAEEERHRKEMRNIALALAITTVATQLGAEWVEDEDKHD